MESSVRRCIHCSLRLRHLSWQSLREVSDEIYNTLASWISPTAIKPLSRYIQNGIIWRYCGLLSAALMQFNQNIARNSMPSQHRQQSNSNANQNQNKLSERIRQVTGCAVSRRKNFENCHIMASGIRLRD